MAHIRFLCHLCWFYARERYETCPTQAPKTPLFWLYWDNGKENGNYYNGLYRIMGHILGLQSLRILKFSKGAPCWGSQVISGYSSP